MLVMAIGFLHARVRTANGANDVLLTAWIAVAGVVLLAVGATTEPEPSSVQVGGFADGGLTLLVAF